MALKRIFAYAALVMFTSCTFVGIANAAIDNGGGSSGWSNATIAIYVPKSTYKSTNTYKIYLSCPAGSSSAATTCPQQGYISYAINNSIKKPTTKIPYYILSEDISRKSTLSSKGWKAIITRPATASEKQKQGVNNITDTTYDIPLITDSATGTTTVITFDTKGGATQTKPSAAPTIKATVPPVPSASASTAASQTPAAGPADFIFNFGKNNAIVSGCNGTNIYTQGLLKGMPCGKPITSLDQVEKFVVNIMSQILIPLAGLIFTIMIIVGGIVYITSAGNTKQIERGKAILTAAIIGLLITFCAYAIVTLFANFIRVS